MTNLQSIIEQALEHGFTHAGELNCSALEFMSEVRDMCAADRCRSYGKNWTCPPACGALADAAARASRYKTGVLVQTVGILDDDFDYETMEATGQKHSKQFLSFVNEIKKTLPDILPMGAGACTLCEKCSCPDEPCRYPDQAIVSMEAFGLFVSKVCTQSGMAYNRGPLTVTYSSCILLG